MTSAMEEERRQVVSTLWRTMLVCGGIHLLETTGDAVEQVMTPLKDRKQEQMDLEDLSRRRNR